MKTPLRYAGGKSKAYDAITNHIPKFDLPKRIISPFIGGGSLECRWASELGIPVHGFDIFHPLVNFWKMLLSNPKALADHLSLLHPSKEKYVEIKELLLQWDYTQDMLKDWQTDHYKRTPITLDSITAAAYYYFNHNLSYGPMYLGWMSKIYEDMPKWQKMIDGIRKFNNTKLVVDEAGFKDTIENHRSDFLYLDPPYLLGGDGNKMFKGIYPNANIDVHHRGFDHEGLRDLLHNHKGSFILSYNDCPQIREWYSDFEQHFPTWHYSYALGEKRIGKNKLSNDAKKSHEILIVKL